MATRRQWHMSALSALACASLLAACGGGESEPSTTRVVSFGDSLSDLGTYTIATSSVPGVAPYFGGRFTTNTHTSYTAATSPLSSTATIWVEWVAARVGVPITQAMLGFATTRIPCPAAANAALAQSCTAYGQGGSRVTDPNGINKAQGALTDPLVTQVAAHLARFTSFSGGDIVFVFAGGNDMLTQLTAVGGGLDPVVAVGRMQTAGTELATLVKDQIVAKGATRVAVINLPDLAATPQFSGQSAQTKGLIGQMTAAFNTAVTTGLGGADVKIIDANAFFADVIANPAKYSLANVTTTACDPAKMAPATGGSSLFCNATPVATLTALGLPTTINSLRSGASASTWFFADGVHPTAGGHKLFSEFVIGKLKEFGWMPINL
ncbi:MAG: SGNH/GDSL hydrolase family protein [Pseudomonadota bacterium]